MYRTKKNILKLLQQFIMPQIQEDTVQNKTEIKCFQKTVAF